MWVFWSFGLTTQGCFSNSFENFNPKISIRIVLALLYGWKFSSTFIPFVKMKVWKYIYFKMIFIYFILCLLLFVKYYFLHKMKKKILNLYYSKYFPSNCNKKKYKLANVIFKIRIYLTV